MWLVFWACSQDTGELPPLSEAHKPQIEASPAELSPPRANVPPLHKSEGVQEVLEMLQSDSMTWTEHKSCLVKSNDPDVPGGWMFYAWNPEGTIGMVVRCAYRTTTECIG